MNPNLSAEGARDVHAAQRGFTAGLLLVAASALFVGGLYVPAISAAVRLTPADAWAPMAAFLLINLAAAAIYSRGKGNSRLYHFVDRLESLTGTLFVCTLIYRSGSAVSFFWFFHFVQVYMTSIVGSSRYYAFTIVVGPLALALLFGLREQVASAWISLVAGLLGFFVYRVLARFHDQLELARQREQSLRAELALSRVGQERVRISQDLHDSVATELTALTWRVREIAGSVADPAARGALDSVAQRLRGAVSGLRNVVLELRDSAADPADAVMLLEQRCRELCGPLAFEFTSHGLERAGFAGPLREILPICAELVQNAARHSGGSRIAVVLRLADELELQVRNDGRALSDETWAASRGGLSNVRKRVEALGGQIVWASGEGGTSVRVELPKSVPRAPDG